MPRFKRLLWTLLALAFLGLSWLWEALHPPIRWVINQIPLEGLKRAVAVYIERLPPYPTLLIFLVPLIGLEPGKLLAFWLMAKGQWLLGIALYLGIDVLKLGLVSFLFKTNKDKLLSIGWFNWLYGWFVRVHAWARAQVEPLKAAAHKALVDAGLSGKSGALGRKLAALWRHARRGGFRNA